MGPHFFSEELFCLLTGLEFKPSVDLLYHGKLQQKLEKVGIIYFIKNFDLTHIEMIKFYISNRSSSMINVNVLSTVKVLSSKIDLDWLS